MTPAVIQSNGSVELHNAVELVGPWMVSIIGDVDLAGEHTESQVAVQLRALEAKLSASPAVAGAVLSLSAPDEPSLGL